MQSQLVFFSSYTLIITEGGILNKPATHDLKKPIPQKDPSQPVSPRINSFYPKMKHFGRLSIMKDTVVISGFLSSSLDLCGKKKEIIYNVLLYSLHTVLCKLKQISDKTLLR